MSISEDLTERLHSLVKKNTSVFEFLYNSDSDGYCFFNIQNSSNKFINTALSNTLGYTDTTRDHQAFNVFTEKDDQRMISSALEKKCSDSSNFKGDVTLKNFEKIKIPFTYLGVKLKTNEHTYLLCCFKKQSYQQVKRDTKLAIYQKLFENTNLAAWRCDNTTRKFEYNETWVKLLGYSLDEFNPTSIEEIRTVLHPDELTRARENFVTYLEGKSPFYETEIRMKHKNGHWIWMRSKAVIVSYTEDGEPEWIYGYREDIDKEKKEVEIKKSFIAEIPSATAMLDRNLNYLAASKKWLTNYNIDSKNFIGKSHLDFFPNLQQRWKDIYALCLQGETKRSGEELFVDKNGKEIWLIWEIKPWYNSENKIGGILIYSLDITEDKTKAKEKEINALLRVTKEQNQRLKNFAQIVSHNLRSHYGNSEMLLEMLEEENPSLRNTTTFDYIRKTTERLNSAIYHLNDVILINSTPSCDFIKVDLNEVLKTALINAEMNAAKHKVSITNSINETTHILGIKTYLESIIHNLVDNAIKFSSPERTSFLKITYTKEDLFGILTFEDNGLGIDLEKNKNKLFGMYKTFHKHIEARGVGLFICKHQAEAMGGHIEIESTVNVGTIFKVFLQHE
ncbi:PAS domain-containing protein [Cochleicola gelatinilyticus]|nr:PAS domain-containing protein [Cochleicola gelatinilyticus]